MMSVGVGVIAALVANQFMEAGLKTLVKAATNQHPISDSVFVLYSNLLALFLLLPSTFLYYRKRAPPPMSTSILCRIFLLGCIRTANQTLTYAGIGYSSATLASATRDLVPAFAFILAIFSRMENLNLKVHGLAKMSGTVISIAGALILTLYKGMPLTILPDHRALLGESSEASTYISLVESNWILGGFLLAIAAFFLSLMFIVQTWIIKEYPEELIVTTTCGGFVVILSAIVALFEKENREAWILRPDMELVAMLFSGILVIPTRGVFSAWACRMKGPFFVAMFNPLAMVIALVMGLIFLGDNLYLGSIIGAATTAVGFYAVLWAMVQEKNMVINDNNDKNDEFTTSSSTTTPLLPKKSSDCA